MCQTLAVAVVVVEKSRFDNVSNCSSSSSSSRKKSFLQSVKL